MKIRYKNRFDKQRRDLLTTIAKAGISASLLRASPLVGGLMASRVAEAATGPNKSIITLVPGGAYKDWWVPSNSLGLKITSKAYEAVKNEVVFLGDGEMVDGAHGKMFAHFTARSFNESSFEVDAGLALSKGLHLQYLNLGVKTEESRLSRNKRTEVPTIDSPNSAFSQLLGGIGGDGGSAPADDPRVHIVDVHMQAIKALQSKLGSHEKEKIDNHLDAINDLEKRLAGGNTGGGATCSSIKMPSASGADDFDKDANLQIEIAVLALKCDLTRSVSISFGNDSHEFPVPVTPENCHASHHKHGARAKQYEKTSFYLHSLNARLIQRVKEEGMLNETVLTSVSDMGDAHLHTNENVPMTVAGGGSAVKRGSVASMKGKTNAHLFQTVSNILGVGEAEGTRTWSSGTISGISS